MPSLGDILNLVHDESDDTLRVKIISGLLSLLNPISANETGNSTVVPLGNGGVFTGVAEDVSQYAAVSVQVRTDQASAGNGLVVSFSPDGTNWDTPYVVTVSANQEKTIVRPVVNKYFRVTYTNGATPQGFMRLQTIFHAVAPGPTMIDTLGDAKETLTPRALVRSDNMLFSGSGWDRQREVVNGQDTVGTGIAAAGLLAQLDDTSPSTVTENQFGPLRMSSRRVLRVEGVSGGDAIPVSAATMESTLASLLTALTAGRSLVPVQGTATGSGNTTIITGVSAKKIRVYFFEANNGGTADITPYFTFATSSLNFGKALLAKNGGMAARSLGENYVEGGTAEDLKINLSASGTVNWTILYTLI
jgi:hypothetical protein